jgi:hypothetical protein
MKGREMPQQILTLALVDEGRLLAAPGDGTTTSRIKSTNSQMQNMRNARHILRPCPYIKKRCGR